MWIVELTESALVLGSTQAIESIDAEQARSAGITLARRRSGGGAVWLHPRQSVWVDITIPRDDPEWVDDVPTSMNWVGGVFRSALLDVCVTEVSLTPYSVTDLSRTVCFGGLAPGEVVAGGAKMVGISQRRTREGARFQCVAYTEWNTDPWVDALADPSVRESVLALDVAEIPVDAAEFFRRVHTALPR